MTTRQRAHTTPATERVGAHLSALHLAQAKVMLEEELEEQVRACCAVFRVARHHTYDSRHSRSGWPDDILIGTRILYRELKRVGRHPTPEQRTTLALLKNAGADVGVWTPVEWFDGTIAAQISAISPRSGRR